MCIVSRPLNSGHLSLLLPDPLFFPSHSLVFSIPGFLQEGKVGKRPLALYLMPYILIPFTG
jgi:hypothetical protein